MVKKDNNNGLILLGLLVLMGIGSMLASNNKSSPSTDDLSVKTVARDRLRAKLKDPGSLEIIEERVERPSRSGRPLGYWCKYRAKNGFGGYTVEEWYDE